MFPRLITFTATGRSTAHTKCRNEVEDLKRSVKLFGWAVADNENEAGKLIEKNSSLDSVRRTRANVQNARVEVDVSGSSRWSKADRANRAIIHAIVRK